MCRSGDAVAAAGRPLGARELFVLGFDGRTHRLTGPGQWNVFWLRGRQPQVFLFRGVCSVKLENLTFKYNEYLFRR